MTAVIAATVQVSRIALGTAPFPVEGTFTAVLGSPLTVPGQVLLGAPLPLVGADINGYGSAVGHIGEGDGNGYVIGPFVEAPTTAGGGTVLPRVPVARPVPVHARGRARGLLAEVEARGQVVNPVRLDIAVTADVGDAVATGYVIQPLVLTAELLAPVPSSEARGQVIRPVRARIKAVGRVQRPRLHGGVIEPALGVGIAQRQPVAVHMAGSVLWLLEREELWLVGLGSMETEEELVGV